MSQERARGRIQRKKLTLQLLTVAAVALAIAIGISIFFKVDTVNVSGLEKYSYDSLRDAAGIQEGDSLLFFSRAEVSSKIMQELPYIKSVRIGITLPGTVNIEVEEVAVAYAVRDLPGDWWLVSADGVVLERTDEAEARDHTTIDGVTLNDPQVGRQAQAAETSGDSQTITAADRLQVALEILRALEANELLGEFRLVDVTDLYDLQLWHGTDYQFLLGDSTKMELKLALVRAYLPEILADYPAGTLDVSEPENPNGSPFTKFE